MPALPHAHPNRLNLALRIIGAGVRPAHAHRDPSLLRGSVVAACSFIKSRTAAGWIPMPCFPGPPAGWMEYEKIHGKYKGNGCFPCSMECCTVEVSETCEPSCLKMCCSCCTASCCSPPCPAGVFVWHGCCGVKPGGLPCCCCPMHYCPFPLFEDVYFWWDGSAQSAPVPLRAPLCPAFACQLRP